MQYQVMPDLTPIEYEALKADIAERGVLVPVEVDENGAVLDGHHRIRAWHELCGEGVELPDYPRMIRTGLTEEQKRNHARSLNVLRRHLSKDQRDEVMRDMRRDGMSYQEIADKVGVSIGTAHSAARDVELFKSEKLIGADGKARPSSYERRAIHDRRGAMLATFPGLYAPSGAKQKEALTVLNSAAPDVADKILRGEATITEVKRAMKEERREERRQENAVKAAAAPDPLEANAHFATILIDPPWDWSDEGDVNQLGRAKPDYSTMTIDQLLALPVGELADEDCHLYLWITNRSLPKGFVLLEAWGFRYVTCLTWVKPSFGMGNYFRGQTEHVLFGVKGSQMLKRRDAGTVFHADRGPAGHSSKPPMIYDLIESCSPGPYLEMFSRCQHPGWSAWGADA